MITSRKSALISTFAALLSLVVLARPSAALSYSAAGDFSATSNPNSPWSYGSLAVLSGFTLDSSNVASFFSTGLSGWLGNLDARPDGIPYILHNGTANPITLANSTYQPGQLGLQAGLNGQYSDVRWTAPFSGSFSIAATFSGLSSAGDSSDVHILLNGTSIFDANVNGSPSPQSYSALQSIAAGATLDFISGDGDDGSPNEGNTALNALIIAVPEPATLGLVGMGLGCLLSFRLRKQTQKNGRPVISTTEHSASILSTRKATLIATAATSLCLATFVLPSTASASSAAGDFSNSSNPNGVWSYGFTTSLGSAFNAYSISTNNYAGLSLNGWLGTSDSSGTPYALHNGTAHNVTNSSTIYQPGQLGLQPGAQDQYSVIRWTAPFSGTFSINATFSGLDSVGDSSDVHILLNGVSFFDASVGGIATYGGNQALTAGDIIDFAVGFGSNGNNFSDTTALSATIVPEPAALGLVGMGLACLLSFRFLKRK